MLTRILHLQYLKGLQKEVLDEIPFLSDMLGDLNNEVLNLD